MKPYSHPFLAVANGEMVQTLVYGRTIHPYFWTTGCSLAKIEALKVDYPLIPHTTGVDWLLGIVGIRNLPSSTREVISVEEN
jgi:hypothetical protein